MCRFELFGASILIFNEICDAVRAKRVNPTQYVKTNPPVQIFLSC